MSWLKDRRTKRSLEKFDRIKEAGEEAASTYNGLFMTDYDPERADMYTIRHTAHMITRDMNREIDKTLASEHAKLAEGESWEYNSFNGIVHNSYYNTFVRSLLEKGL